MKQHSTDQQIDQTTDLPTLVFVHGAGGCGLQWNYQTVFFRRLGYPVLAIDLPGHGHAKGYAYGPGKRTMTDYANVLETTLRDRKISQAVLIGHSMGGGVVLTEVLRNPYIGIALVLVSTGAKLRVRPDLLTVLRDHPEKAPVPIVEASYPVSTHPSVLRRAEKQVREVDPEVLLGDFLASDNFDVRNQLKNIAIPTLIIAGADDELTPVRYSEYLHAHVAQSRLAIIENAGHMVMLEQPKAFNQVIERFLADYPWQ
jgi:pimeloyl-ACP methyl ester carboxylesterase